MVKVTNLILGLMILVGGGNWLYHAAGIVAGEAPGGCLECARVTACTIKLQPYNLGRWYGWREPTAYHKNVVLWATDENCASYPVCDFLGTRKDYELFESWGWVNTKVEYCNKHGCSVCGWLERAQYFHIDLLPEAKGVY